LEIFGGDGEQNAARLLKEVKRMATRSILPFQPYADRPRHSRSSMIAFVAR
jgi:hypothetical protein